MDTISSFQVDHTKLLPGIYKSRIDQIGKEKLITYDIRIKTPNVEEPISTGSAHAIEHIGAVYLRNISAIKNKVVYFGPMGCRTGFYLIVANENALSTIIDLVKGLCEYVICYNGSIPGASIKECGNFRDMDLVLAKQDIKKYYEEWLCKDTVYTSYK